ncbi:unnamed protein product, partial [Prorocentrum cordatum]
MGTRHEQASRWFCKSCTNDRTGKPWWNMVHAKKCAVCGLAKQVGFKCNATKQGAPSVSAKPPTPTPPWREAGQAAQANIKEFEAQVRQLQLHGDKLRASPTAGADGATATAHAETLQTEKEDIDGTLQASRPMYAKLQTLPNRLKAAAKRAEVSRELAQARQEQFAEVQKSLQEAKATLGEQQKEMAALSAQAQALTSADPQTPEAAKLPEKGLNLQLDVEAMGKFLEQQGSGGQSGALARTLAKDMQALLAPNVAPKQEKGAHPSADSGGGGRGSAARCRPGAAEISMEAIVEDAKEEVLRASLEAVWPTDVAQHLPADS